jgi:hypothetical protein
MLQLQLMSRHLLLFFCVEDDTLEHKPTTFPTVRAGCSDEARQTLAWSNLFLSFMESVGG